MSAGVGQQWVAVYLNPTNTTLWFYFCLMNGQRVDSGPILKQHWLNVLCLLVAGWSGMNRHIDTIGGRVYQPTMPTRAVGGFDPSGDSAQWARDVDPMLVWCWAGGADGGPTLAKHRSNREGMGGDWRRCDGILNVYLQSRVGGNPYNSQFTFTLTMLTVHHCQALWKNRKLSRQF